MTDIKVGTIEMYLSKIAFKSMMIGVVFAQKHGQHDNILGCNGGGAKNSNNEEPKLLIVGK